jgi:hypothetical protein
MKRPSTIQAPPIPGCLRWRERKDLLRPALELRFDPSRYGVEITQERAARPFVEAHHYSGSYPAARLAVGLYRKRAGWYTGDLVGVAVFSVPIQPRSVELWLGLPEREAVELGRFVLLDEVEANAETWFLTRAVEVLRAELRAVRGVLSYSDPLPRHTLEGHTVTPGHVGTIYQAANAAYLGQSEPRYQLLDAKGRTISARALSKVRLGEVGGDGAARRLVEAGLPARRFGEEPAAWLARAMGEALASGVVRRVLHPGCHAYGLRGLGACPVEPARAAVLSALASASSVFPEYPKKEAKP